MNHEPSREPSHFFGDTRLRRKGEFAGSSRGSFYVPLLFISAALRDESAFADEARARSTRIRKRTTPSRDDVIRIPNFARFFVSLLWIPSKHLFFAPVVSATFAKRKFQSIARIICRFPIEKSSARFFSNRDNNFKRLDPRSTFRNGINSGSIRRRRCSRGQVERSVVPS